MTIGLRSRSPDGRVACQLLDVLRFPPYRTRHMLISLRSLRSRVVAPSVVFLPFVGGAGCGSSSSNKNTAEMASAPAGSNVPAGATVHRGQSNSDGQSV